MINFGWKSLIFIFLLCFGSFLAGWLTAVFILPRSLPPAELSGTDPETMELSKALEIPSSPKEQETKPPTDTEKSLPFFEEMKDNIILLFNPYKMDSLIKKNTYLDKNTDGPIKTQKAKAISLKVPSFDKKNKNSTPKSNIQKPSSYSSLQKLVPLGSRPKKAEDREESVLKKLQKEYDKKNREQFAKIPKDQQFFLINGKFSFLVNVFSEQKPALTYIQSIKEIYPMWSFFIKAYKDHIRVYLGPFASKEKAMEFKKSAPQPLSFTMDFLEEVSL